MEVAKLFLDALDHGGVTAPRMIGQAREVVAGLILLQHADQGTLRWRHLARHRLIVGSDKFRCSGFADQWRA